MLHAPTLYLGLGIVTSIKKSVNASHQRRRLNVRQCYRIDSTLLGEIVVGGQFFLAIAMIAAAARSGW